MHHLLIPARGLDVLSKAKVAAGLENPVARDGWKTHRPRDAGPRGSTFPRCYLASPARKPAVPCLGVAASSVRPPRDLSHRLTLHVSATPALGVCRGIGSQRPISPPLRPSQPPGFRPVSAQTCSAPSRLCALNALPGPQRLAEPRHRVMERLRPDLLPEDFIEELFGPAERSRFEGRDPHHSRLSPLDRLESRPGRGESALESPSAGAGSTTRQQLPPHGLARGVPLVSGAP